jgi:hypothetical protein
MQALTDLRLGALIELFGQSAQQGTSDNGQIRQEVWITGTRLILSHEHVPPPVIADFHSRPVPTNELKPFQPRVLVRFGAGEVITRLGATHSGLLNRALAAHYDERSGVGKIGFQGLDGERVDLSGLYTAVSGSGLVKKGVFFSPSSACAFFNKFS